MSKLLTLVNSAYETAKRGDHRRALEEFELILSHDPNHPDALYGAAACSYRLGKHEQALGLLDRLLWRQPGNPAARQLKARVQGEAMLKSSQSSERHSQLAEARPQSPFSLEDRLKEDVIEAWNALDVRIPSAGARFREGKIEQTRVLNSERAFSEAWRFYRANFKRLVLAGWLALGIKGLYLLFLAAGLSIFLEAFRGMWGLQIFFGAIFGALGFWFGYPLLGLLPYYCYRLKREGPLPLRAQFLFIEKYPAMLFSLQWVHAPLVATIGGILFGDLTGAYDWLGSIFEGGWGYYLLLFLLGLQFYLMIRCWFFNLVFISGDFHPITGASRSYYLTGGNAWRVFTLAVAQIFLLPFALAPLGVGIGFLAMTQVETFEQLDRKGEDPGLKS